ncbi:MAG: FAD:protein FMN transferase [Acidobacteria bacterium]|nr:FAD:protein FMN transferase [Acidobacteriota bacterium]
MIALTLILFLLQAPVTREVYLMGTRVTLTTYSTNAREGSRSLEKYIRILEQTESELSVWRPSTMLSRVNAQRVNEPFPLSSQLFALFEELFSWWRLTDGSFDPGIGRLLQAWGLYGDPRVPSEGEIDSAVRVSGLKHFSLRSDSLEVVRLADAAMDSGAFGKGEGLDRVFRQALLDGSDPWIIDLGGQVMVYGRPPGKQSWTVNIAHPQKRTEAVLKLQLTSGSIATSGLSERPGHILDPRTGRPAAFNGSVVVWHDRALVADILSTALFVMGPEDGLRWAESKGYSAGYLIPIDGRLEIRATSGFRRRFML